MREHEVRIGQVVAVARHGQIEVMVPPARHAHGEPTALLSPAMAQALGHALIALGGDLERREGP